MRVFFDTEFIERGSGHPLVLISLGAVREDGETFYAVSSEFSEDDCNDWVKANVLPNLGDAPRKPVSKIASEFAEFAGNAPEFWADYCSYDWVVLCQMYGTMMDLPKGWPMWCRDLQQVTSKSVPSSTPHNALEDAKAVRVSLALSSVEEAARSGIMPSSYLIG